MQCTTSTWRPGITRACPTIAAMCGFINRITWILLVLSGTSGAIRKETSLSVTIVFFWVVQKRQSYCSQLTTDQSKDTEGYSLGPLIRNSTHNKNSLLENQRVNNVLRIAGCDDFNAALPALWSYPTRIMKAIDRTQTGFGGFGGKK